MKNKSLLLLSLLMLTSLFASAQLSELSGYKISVSSAEATDFTTGQWYVIKSRGRAAYAYENSSNAMFMKSGNADGEAATASCGSLIRFVSAGSGKYYIQTGYGHYLKSGNANGAILAVVNTSAAGTFTVGKINSIDAHFYMQDASTNFVVDANPAGSSMAYWGTTVPTNAAGTQNNDWALYAVTLNMDQAAWFSDQIGSGKAFRLQCRLGYTGSPTYQYAAVNASGENVVATKATSGDDAYRQIWIIEPSGTGFTLRNVSTGLYITSSVSGSGSATPGTFYGKRSDSNVDSSTEYVTLSTSSVFSGSSCLHHQESGHRLVTWPAGTESGNYASDWVLEPVEDITTAEIKEKLNAALGYSLPTSGKTYRLYNTAYNLTAAELTSGHTTLCGEHAVTDYTALWNVTISGGQITLQNAITDRYIQKQNGAVSTVYTTGESAASFTLADASNWVYTYTLADAGGIGLHCASSQNNNIVGWYTDEAASVWRFEEVTPDASILAASRDTYQEHLDMKENASTYNTALQTFFTDGTCTQLRSPYATYSDANLRSAMTSAGLPSAFVTMALKVKNNTWTTYSGWDKTEKTFRVAEYQPYSDYQRWTSILGQGYYVGRLANPTGVSASNGELVYVYVGSIPSGQTVALEAVSLGAASGPQTTLTEGLNVVEIDGDANLFIYNSVDNTTSGGAPFTALSSYSPVSVHIEGGYINGYFDLRRGDTDTDWEQLNAHLLSADAVDIRSLNYCMHLSKSETVAAVNEGGTLTGLLEIWDNILSAQRELQGLEDYDGYFNNPLSFTSPGSTGAHASNHGVFVATNQLSFLMNYNSMNTEANALWEAAHETGHIHQNPINMIGCMEISNNVFSNVSIYQQGRYTSRSRSIQDTFSEFADGISWLDRIFDSSASSEQADLWQGTHLYWQLYQFFHLAGYDTDFYPQLYKTFRADRMNHANNTFVPASEDYLKFYKTCCSVSGYDLTEFFQVYGFFTIPTQTSYTLSGTTRDAHLVGDYANYYVYATQEMIDAVKAEVAAMNLPKANIIFIEDRITAPDATYAGAAAGTKKTSYATGWSNCGEIGNCGEMGQYTSFATPISGSYEYTVDSEGNVTVSGGSGAVGIKVYDGSGNLAFVANTSTFTLPSSLVGGTYTIKAAGGNGSDVTILKAGETPVTYPFSFSTEESPVYYYIKFKAGEAVLADQGTGNNVLTEEYEQNSEAQKWAFIGTADNFVLKSKSGGYLNYASSRYNTSATGTPMTIVTSGTDYFEMRRTAGSQYLNQYGGYGIGKQLGEWTQADANNIFSVEEVGNIDTSLPIFTTPDSPKYYYAKFYNGGNVLADQGSGSNLLTESMVDADADQLWAFYGTRENFVMCSKTGNYVNFASSRYTADASGVALALKATGNASATGCWEIKRVEGSSYMNQFGGSGVGVQLGEYTYGDVNNPIRFVATEAELPEFSTEDDEHWYYLQFCNGMQALRAATAGGNVTYVTLETEDEQKWKFVGTQSNFQLVSKTGLYAVISGTGNDARLQSQTTPDANGFSLVATANATYKPNWEIHWNGSNNGKENLNRWGGGELSVSEIGMWSANDSNNPFYFVESSAVDNLEKVSFTWIVTDANDVEVYRSAATTHIKGTTVTALPDELLAFKSRFVSYPSETSLSIAADETKEVRVAYQWDGPFCFSSTERHYYALEFDNYASPYVQAGSEAPYALTQTRSGDAYRWFFEGNPFSGITLRNKLYPSLGLEATSLNTDGSAGPTLTSTPTAFEIYNWNTNGTNNGYFALRVPTTSDYYLNNYSGGAQMKYWSSGPGDVGSRISVEGCLEFADGYYRLYNKVNPTHWLNITENGYKVNTLVGTTEAEAEAAALADPSTVFRFQEQSDGSYLISSRGAYLTTQTSYSQPVVVSENASEAFSCKLACNSDGTWSIQVGSGAYNYLDNNENYKNYDAASGIVTWEKADENSHWYMVPAESYKVSLNKPSGSDKTFATVYLPFAYTMPAAATANVINVNQQTKMAETHAISGIVPAGTPALFISDEGATQVELTITLGDLESDTETLCEGNELAGNYVETDTPAGTYTFQAPKGVPGFYKYTGAKLKAYRAFLPGDVATQTKGFIISFGDATTGISDVTTSGTDERVFDLQGRRVARPTRGIYIIGGKKVLR